MTIHSHISTVILLGRQGAEANLCLLTPGYENDTETHVLGFCRMLCGKDQVEQRGTVTAQLLKTSQLWKREADPLEDLTPADTLDSAPI